MNRSLATRSVFGIGRAMTQPMKNLYSDSHPEREALEHATTRAAEWSQKIRILFKDDTSTHDVTILIKDGHVSAKASIPEFNNCYKVAHLHPSPCHES